MLKVVSRGTETLTHPVQFVVEPARVAHRLPRAIPPPQSGGGRVTIGTLRPLSPLGVLKAEKAERLSQDSQGEIRIGSHGDGGGPASRGEDGGAGAGGQQGGQCCRAGTDRKQSLYFALSPAFSP